MRTAAKSH